MHMRGWCKLLMLSGVLALAPAAARAGALPPAAMEGLPDVVAPLMGAVVNISVLKQAAGTDAKGGDPMAPPVALQGSGFIIDPAGFIVTNRHVVEGAYSVTAVLEDGSSYPAQVLSTNARPDLALLKVDAGKKLPVVAFGDSDTLRIGQPVIAIGNPLGLSGSVSVGIVSALNRDINTTMIDDFIQTDAAINHGNSGGPLFNMRGEVIGVNWALLAPGGQTGSSGLGLAIPSNDASWVIDQMRRFGRLHAGFLGLRIQQVTPDIQAALGLPARNGGIVSALLPNGPAAKAGIHEGDVVTALNGKAPRDVRALLRALGASAPGTTITLDVWQDGTTRSIPVTLTEWSSVDYDPAGPQPQSDRGTRQVTADLGLHLVAADAATRRTLKLTQVQPAVSVKAVSANSPAADAGLAAGDAILKVQRTPVHSAADVKQSVRQARAAGRDSVLVLVQSASGPRWVVVPIKTP